MNGELLKDVQQAEIIDILGSGKVVRGYLYPWYQYKDNFLFTSTEEYAIEKFNSNCVKSRKRFGWDVLVRTIGGDCFVAGLAKHSAGDSAVNRSLWLERRTNLKAIEALGAAPDKIIKRVTKLMSRGQ